MSPGQKNREEYERRLHRVLAYIDQHLDEPINLARLAKEASFSTFHFHRIFSAHVGETLGNLTRRRVEQAAARLASQPRLGILEVALAVGFGSAEAFSRSFKQHFGRSPSQWRLQPQPAGKKSKLGQAKGKAGHAGKTKSRYTSSMAKNTSSPLHVTIVNRAPVKIAYLRYQGSFGPPVGKFWQETVYPWMVASDLLGAPRYGVSQDDPDVTNDSKCRYDAGAEVGDDFVPSRQAQIAVVAGGRYASTKFLGTSSEIPRAWERILREWLPASGYQLDARLCFEFYPVDGTYDEKTGAFSCELCIPVAKL